MAEMKAVCCVSPKVAAVYPESEMTAVMAAVIGGSGGGGLGAAGGDGGGGAVYVTPAAVL